jgi:hypothetical protein
LKKLNKIAEGYTDGVVTSGSADEADRIPGEEMRMTMIDVDHITIVNRRAMMRDSG